MTDWAASSALAEASAFGADWPVCQVRLHHDGRFPWLLLLPRMAGATELEDVPVDRRAALAEEIVRGGSLVRRLGELEQRPVDKLNVAAIGNVAPQLHVHVIGRRRDDALWPDPVWGRGPPEPRTPEAEARLLAEIAAWP